MPNPVNATWRTKCAACDNWIEVDDRIYFTDDGKMCTDCAGYAGFVCECGNFKKDEYETCWECK